MGCKLYIDKYAPNDDVRDTLYNLHDSIENRLKQSGLFSFVQNEWRLPRKNSIANVNAKEYIDDVNIEMRTKVVGIREDAGNEIAFVNVKNLAPQVEADLLREQMNDVPVGKTEITHEALRTLNNLSAKFNIKWQIDDKQATVGRFDGGTVYINSKKLAPDTPFHEFAHPFEQAIKQNNSALWSSLAQRASNFSYNGQRIEDFVLDEYPDLEGDDLISEIIVTAIGLAATNPKGFKEDVPKVRTFLNAIFTYLKQFLGVDSLSEHTTIAQLADMMRSSRKIDLASTEFSNAEQRKSATNKGDTLNELERLNDGLELTQNEENYEIGTTLLQRGTSWVTEHFSSKEKQEFNATSNPAEHRAIKYYEKRGANKNEQIIWEETGKKVDFPQLVEIMKEELELDAKQGTLIHSIIENIITPSNKVVDKIQELYDTYGFEQWKFNWLSKEYITNLMRYRLRLNVSDDYEGSPDADVVKSEVKVHSKILNVGTAIDLLVNHSNGALSLFDFKTGAGLYKDAGTVNNMQFGELLNDIVKDTRLNHGKMELMLRAFIIKEQIPNARFRDLAIIHMGNGRKTSVHDISMHTYLEMLEEYFKKEKPQQHAEFEKLGMFNIDNYTSASKSMEEETDSSIFEGKSVTEKADLLAIEIEQLGNKYKFLGEKIPDKIQEQIAQKTQALFELRGMTKSEALSDTKDLGWLTKHFGTLYDVANPVVQRFLRFAREKDNEKAVAYNKIKNEQRKFVEKIKQESPVKAYHTDDMKGMFDFMWKRKTVGNLEGFYRQVLTEQDLKDGKCTKTQLEYSQWYDKTLKELYGTLDEKVDGKRTKGQLLGVGVYTQDFMPRIPMLSEEVFERDRSIGQVGQRILSRNLRNFFIKEQYKDLGVGNKIGIPVKYMGSKAIISSGNYSMNTEAIMLNFADNMLEKKYSDKVYATGKGVLTVLEGLSGNEQKNTREWLDAYLDGVVANKKEEMRLTRMERYVPFTKLKVNFPTIFNSMNTVLTASAMWLSAGAGMVNAFLALGMNVKEAVTGNVLKSIDADYTTGDLRFGLNEWRKAFAKNNFISGPKNESTTKMMRFIEMMQFSTTHFKGHIGPEQLVSTKHRLLNKSNLYIFHSIGEEMSLYSAMAAMLNHMKVKNGKGEWIKITFDANGDPIYTPVSTKEQASSMWDAHKITEDGDFRYIGPSRGFTKEGIQINGLTSDEITKMQRVTQRVNGSYREHERSMIEHMAFGEWIMKFKKYLPAIWRDRYQSQYNDFSMGEFTQLYEADGITPKLIKNAAGENENVYEWQGRLNEGRIKLMMNWAIATLASVKYKEDPRFAKYRWSNLQATQKQQLVRTATAMVMSFLMFTARTLAFWDDDEKEAEKDPMYKRMVRLQDDMFTFNPAEIIRPAVSPILQVQFLYKAMTSSYSFLFDGLIMGERVKTGPTKGSMPGWTYLKHKLPLINIAYGISENAEEDRIFGIPAGDWLSVFK